MDKVGRFGASILGRKSTAATGPVPSKGAAVPPAQVAPPLQGYRAAPAHFKGEATTLELRKALSAARPERYKAALESVRAKGGNADAAVLGLAREALLASGADDAARCANIEGLSTAAALMHRPRAFENDLRQFEQAKTRYLGLLEGHVEGAEMNKARRDFQDSASMMRLHESDGVARAGLARGLTDLVLDAATEPGANAQAAGIQLGAVARHLVDVGPFRQEALEAWAADVLAQSRWRGAEGAVRIPRGVSAMVAAAAEVLRSRSGEDASTAEHREGAIRLVARHLPKEASDAALARMAPEQAMVEIQRNVTCILFAKALAAERRPD